MTYRLFYDARPIKSAVKVVGEGLELDFASGEELQEQKFDIPYRVESITAENDTIVLHIVKRDMHPDLSWSDREVSVFDGS